MFNLNRVLNQRLNFKSSKKFIFTSLIGLPLVSSSIISPAYSFPFGNRSEKAVCSKIHVGTQDQVINTAVGGAVVRELGIFEKNLPRSGEYSDLDYKLEWSSYTSGPPITNKMVANQIQIGLMGDFPAVINLIKGREGNGKAKTIYIGTLAYSPNGAGNAVVVPINSSATKLKDLKGGTVSVPFGSAAHGMVLKALKDAGLDIKKDVTLISQAPAVGGSALQKNQIAAHADFVPFGELFPYKGFAKKIFDGAQTGVPTLHGITVREDFAKQCPEVVVAFMKSVIQANNKFQKRPEYLSSKIEEWSGIDKEVVYMFLGPSGLQPLTPEIKEVQLLALENSIAVLKSLGKIQDKSIKPSDVRDWIDESYLEAAARDLNTSVEEESAKGSSYVITGKDSYDKSKIENPKMAAQIWIEGEKKVKNFSGTKNMLLALNGKYSSLEPSVLFVHDRFNGWKLFAKNAFYVDENGVISAFLLKSDADEFAKLVGEEVKDFNTLSSIYN